MGITLIIIGLLATVGPLAFDLGGSDSAPSDEPVVDPPTDNDRDESDSTGTSDANDEKVVGPEENDETENNAIWRMIGDVSSGDKNSESASEDEETQEECFID